MSDDPPAIPAATLVVMRDRPGPPPELLMVKRASGMAFAGGAMVFPGGRVDEADRLLGGAQAARVTAIRETLEESAVAVALGPVEPARGRSLQEALIGGEAFDALLDREGLALDLDAIVPFARWRPAFHQARRFDTIFYLARAPIGEWAPSPQPGECESAEWATAASVLERVAAGTAGAIFPTKRNLERLARYASFDEARADAGRYPIEAIVPWIEQRDGIDHVCIPADRGYPVTSEPLSTATRA